MYNTRMNKSNREEIMKVYQTHLKNLMDLEDGEHEIRKKKLQGGFLPMLLPIAAGLLGNMMGKGHTNQHEQNKEGYARDEGVVNVMKKRGRPPKKPMEGSGIISNLGIPGISQIAGLIGLGKTGAGKTGAGHATAVIKPKKTSAWIEFVKKYSKDKGIPYKQALSEAKAHYKK